MQLAAVKSFSCAMRSICQINGRGTVANRQYCLRCRMLRCPPVSRIWLISTICFLIAQLFSVDSYGQVRVFATPARCAVMTAELHLIDAIESDAGRALEAAERELNAIEVRLREVHGDLVAVNRDFSIDMATWPIASAFQYARSMRSLSTRARPVQTVLVLRNLLSLLGHIAQSSGHLERALNEWANDLQRRMNLTSLRNREAVFRDAVTRLGTIRSTLQTQLRQVRECRTLLRNILASLPGQRQRLEATIRRSCNS
jgi:hypothetical protein